MACAECLVLRRNNAALRARIQQLRLVIQDMSGMPPDGDDPYEDERHPEWEKEGDPLPKVPWGNDR